MKCGWGRCFQCIREGTDHGWTYECEMTVLSSFYKHKFDKTAQKMIVTTEVNDESDLEYLRGLVREALETTQDRLEALETRLPQREAEAMGDSIARLYMFLITRDRLITPNDLRAVAPVIRRAAKRSLPAHGLVYVMDGHGLNRPFPKCWLNLSAGRPEENERDGPRKRQRNIRTVD